jgi:predicted nucleic acid-binding protein
MGDPSATEASENSRPPGTDAGIYLDSSALAKLYVPEAASEKLDSFLRGRRGLMVSELGVTEVLSAVARRKREGALNFDQACEIRDAVLEDADSGAFDRLELTPAIHREAERLLFGFDSVPLRTLDALHLALAVSGAATHVVTFDLRMRAAARQAGLKSIDF